MEAITKPAPALPADAQALCNHAVKLGLHPLVQDAMWYPDDPDLGTMVEVALLPRFDAEPETYGWVLAVDPDGDYPLTLTGPDTDDCFDMSWTGPEKIRAALTRYAAPTRQEATQ